MTTAASDQAAAVGEAIRHAILGNELLASPEGQAAVAACLMAFAAHIASRGGEIEHLKQVAWDVIVPARRES